MPLAQRDSQMNGAPHPVAWERIESIHGSSGWASVLVSVGIGAVLVAGAAFVGRKLGLRRRLSWFFALGLVMWMWAPVVADSAAGGLLADAGFLMAPGAVLAEIVLRRRDLDADPVR